MSAENAATLSTQTGASGSAEKHALRSEVAEVIYRELGDMVNRDYLIDALMPVILARVTSPEVTQS